MVRDHDREGGLRGFHGSGSAGRIKRSFQSDAEARAELDRILAAIGLSWMTDRIKLRSSAEAQNAEAFIADNDERLVLYNATFMQRLKERTADDWSLVAILAHEVGHHLAWHTKIDGNDHLFELEADRFSGFIMRRLGATLDQAHAAMRLVSPKEASKTHPGLDQRLEAITLGWRDGGTQGPPQAAAARPPAPQPQASEAAERAWALVKDSSDMRALEAFRKQYGAANPFYDRLAEARVEQIKQAAEAKGKADADAQAKERDRLARLQKQEPVSDWGASVPFRPQLPQKQDEERRRAEEKRKAEEATRRDAALSVKPGSGESFRDWRADGQPCPECPEMVVVPAGSFTMGSPPGEEGRSDNEGPQRQVRIERPFAVGRYEATLAEWDACVTDGGCMHNPKDYGWGRGNRPVVDVSWDDIVKEYLPWLSRRTGKAYRLLTESEWEYGARAGKGTPFWWGSSISTSQANYGGAYVGDPTGDYRAKTVPVDSFAANPWGLYNVHGNVWEWVQDNRHPDYKGAPQDGSVWAGGDISHRILRGGSWSSLNPLNLRSAKRDWYPPGYRVNNVGFRVARTR